MTTLMQASRQWSTRPAEERFLSLTEMHSKMAAMRANSAARVLSSRDLTIAPTDDNRGLVAVGPAGHQFALSNWAMGQTSALVSAPAAYLRTLPAPLAADALNYGLRVERDAQDVGVLLTKHDDTPVLRAVTGPRYGRIWNSDVIAALIERFGDGRNGDFRVPGEYGHAVEVTRDNTTLYAGDRDCFVFLADEVNRIEMPNRRDGKPGSMARGFFVSNSEVGASALRIKTFLFDFVCKNRIVWGAHELEEIAIRHNASAPHRFLEEAAPALLAYANASAGNVENVLHAARATKLDKVDAFLASRFGPRVGQRVQAAHVADEGRPIETIWDVVTGATAYARSIPWTSERVEFETLAGNLLDEVTA